jgi:Domain of unknown function (DUF4333)
VARRILLVPVLALGLFAGCGGESDEDRVETAVESFYAAAADEDGEGMCDLLADADRLALDAAEDCTMLVENELEPGYSEEAESAEVVDVGVAGEGAWARVETDDGGEKTVRLVESDGDWLIEDFDSEPVIDSDKTEAAIEENLAAEVELPIESVECPTDQPVEPGARFECVVGLEGGDEKTATLEIENEDADVAVIRFE